MRLGVGAFCYLKHCIAQGVKNKRALLDGFLKGRRYFFHE
jgi:hypothetical protein